MSKVKLLKNISSQNIFTYPTEPSKKPRLTLNPGLVLIGFGLKLNNSVLLKTLFKGNYLKMMSWQLLMSRRCPLSVLWTKVINKERQHLHRGDFTVNTNGLAVTLKNCLGVVPRDYLDSTVRYGFLFPAVVK